MIYYSTIIPLMLAVLLALFIIPRILVVSVKKELMDEGAVVKDGKKKRIVPRLGGVSLFPILVISVGLPLGCTFLLNEDFSTNGENMPYFVQFMMVLTGLTSMYLLGVMDDLVGVPLKSKLIIELLAAMLVPLSGLYIDHLDGLFGIYQLSPWIGIPLTVVGVLYMTNTISMLDDIDGLASGLSMIAFGVLAVLCGMAEQYLLLMVCVAMVGVLGPFLFRNVMGWRIRWRKLFFGDTGGLTIGYLLAYLVVAISMMGGEELPEGIGIVCFGTLLIPMFDVMRVGITRLVNGRNVFRSGDHNHLHHRLIKCGLSAHVVLVVVLLITSTFIGINIVGVWLGVDLSLLLVIDVSLWLVMQVVIMYFKNRNGEGRYAWTD